MTGNKSIVFRFADVEVHEREFCLLKAGEVLPVEPKTFRVLLFLLRNPQKLITKEELLNAVWGDAIVTDSSLTRTIAQLRRLLGDEVHNPRYIETVATVGYRFLYKVEISEDASENLDKTDNANGSNQNDPVEIFANGEMAEAGVNPLSMIDKPAGDVKRGGKQTPWRLNTLLSWLLPGAAVLAVGLATTIWYSRRPLPPFRVVEYTQITHDGRGKDIAGIDGSRLYINRFYDSIPTAQVAISGGEIVPVQVALPLPSIYDVSPDGSTLLVASFDGGQESLWSVKLPAGSLRRILKDAWVNSAAWSPDGKFVVYCPGNQDLYVIRADGSGIRKLAAVGGLPTALSWSPDGSKIRFSKDNRLWEVSSDGSGLHSLLPRWRLSTSQCCGRWILDGKFFVFSSGSAFLNTGSQLWGLDERRSLFRKTHPEPFQLTSGPIRWNSPIPSKG